MLIDTHRLETSTTSMEARLRFEDAVFGIAAHRPTTGPAIEATFAADADHVAAHALKGFSCLILGRSELIEPARAAARECRRLILQSGRATGDEHCLVDALEHACQGRFLMAADRLDAVMAEGRAPLLLFKISHSLRFMAGDQPGMLKASASAMDILSETGGSVAFIQGCHAFALEEHGRFKEAERVGRRAVEIEPADAWGHHAVSHVFEMSGHAEDGIAWLESGRKHWSRCNNFSFHMAWHLALMHLEQGRHTTVLRIYDEEVRPEQTDDFRDIANAVSLLWRLNHLGIGVGNRWQALADVLRRRSTDTTVVFAALHTLMGLLACGAKREADDMMDALRARTLGSSDQARVAAEIGLPIAQVLLRLSVRSGPSGRISLARLARDLPKIGGSHAQRDVFMLALARAAGEARDTAASQQIRHVRKLMKTEDRLFGTVETLTSA